MGEQINHLLPKTSRTNIALYEVQNMLKEAQEEDDKTGLSRCYNIMSQIYTIKRFDSMAFEWRLKEIELTEKYKIENYNISQTYAQIANYYINQKKQKEALAAVEKPLRLPIPLRNKYLPSWNL